MALGLVQGYVKNVFRKGVGQVLTWGLNNLYRIPNWQKSKNVFIPVLLLARLDPSWLVSNQAVNSG